MILGFYTASSTEKYLTTKAILSGPDNINNTNPSVLAKTFRESFALKITNNFGDDLMISQNSKESGIGIAVDVKA